ncbi:MAG: YggS family pyridoxal phosphate-dependent enzyme [Clostridia bacterium]|nr:YggS family pyridoxal phosphate-dependent enzyme [Clostridia bacterium]
MDGIRERVESIRQRVSDLSLERWGRAAQIIAVTKTVEPERIHELLACGITRIGENRAQEILQKRPLLDASFRIDCIGRLQTNKVKYIIDQVGMIQSLDRMNLALEIDRRAVKMGRRMPVLIEINIGNEPQKGGIPAEELMPFAREAAGLEGLQIRGLMAVMPETDQPQELRPLFAKMRSLFEQLQSEAIRGTQIDELSMGMSGDYEVAAEEGATHLRLGSAIFGKRPLLKLKNA